MERDFSPAIWHEDVIPDYAAGCANCELCNQRTRMVWGEGNPKADIIVILDNPGCKEDKSGNPFVCSTRQTLQSAAAFVGLSEKDLYITYILKCRPSRKYNKEFARGICKEYLEKQIKSNSYRTVFCLGDVAVKTFFSDPERSVKNTRGVWNNIEGFSVYASYHPLAVRRRPNLYNLFITDWEAVAFKNLP